jgi:hypothetical protein
VARYFEVFDYSPVRRSGPPLGLGTRVLTFTHQVILHRGEFFKQYREFWRDPSSPKVRESWLALLFSVLCVSLVLSYGNVFGSAEKSDSSPSVDADLKRLDSFREKTVQALILSNYTKGGPHIIETLLHHILGEMFIRRDCVSRWCK